MQFQDDRTQEQKQTHPLIVIGTDSFLSNWGKASDGNSYAGWACTYGDLAQVEAWVEARGKMKRVRVVAGDYRPNARNCTHCHIYVVHENHPSISRS